MQSLIQYRKSGLAVQRQCERDVEKKTSGFNRSQTLPEIGRDQSNLPESVSSNRPAEDVSSNSETLSRVATQHSARTALGHALAGIDARERTTHEGKGGKVFVVNWDGENDPLRPRNWSLSYRLFLTVVITSIGFTVTAAASIDTAVLPQAARALGVSEVVQSLTIGLYLAGYTAGAVFLGPTSESIGRCAVYISSLAFFMVFIMASALSPNIGAYLAFRFLAGVFGAPPLSVAGGSISDMFSSLEKTFAFPIFAIGGFVGGILGPVIGSYIINLGTWRWAEWIELILSAAVFLLVIVMQPETFESLLLAWKARHLRRETNDDRFRAEWEIRDTSLWSRLRIAITRSFALAIEPIVLFMTLHLTILYIVFFTFLDGYTYIFSDVYGTSQGLTNVIFSAMFVGGLLPGLLVPWIYKLTKTAIDKNVFVPEMRLWFSMLGAPAIPIALFWMGWTDYKSISIWSPIMASVLIGYGTLCIFISCYMYIIDSYEVFAASALTFAVMVRYLSAGGMTVVGIPMYRNLGTHWTLTVLGCISLLMTAIPYVFYKYGHAVRRRSKHAACWD